MARSKTSRKSAGPASSAAATSVSSRTERATPGQLFFVDCWTLDSLPAVALQRRVGRWTFLHSMIPHDKLFIPGPVEVSPKTMAAFSRPMIGHRSEDFKNLYRAVHSKLQELFATKQPVFLSTSSAWGVMEASIRNLVDRGVLCCMCGAFS